MKLPKSVRVGFRTLHIQKLSDEDSDVLKAQGYYDKGRSLIKINTSAPLQEIANTLLHEVIHAAYNVGELESDDDEERVVSVLSNVLCQVVQDNPELISFIQKASKIVKHGTKL